MRPKCIMKFGGSSLADSKAMTRTVEIILQRKESTPLVIVSALGSRPGEAKVTDILQSMAQEALARTRPVKLQERLRRRHEEVLQELHLPATLLEASFAELSGALDALVAAKRPDPLRALDRIMAWGEILSARLVAACLTDRGWPCRAVLPEEARFITNGVFQNADLLDESLETVASAVIASKENLIFPGYIGVTADGERTTLGRGGSDYTAALLGAALKRDVEIWTDVNGIYRANPAYFDTRMTGDGHPSTIPALPHDEAFQMAAFGSKVLYEKCLAAARMAARKGKSIRFHIKNTFNPDHPGTDITSLRSVRGLPKGITCLEKTQLLTFYPRSGEEERVLLQRAAAVEGAKLYLSSCTTGRVSFVFDRLCPEVESLEREFEGHCSKDQVLVKVVGDGLGDNHVLISRIHAALEMAENPERFGMAVVHKSPLLLTENTVEFVVKKRGLISVVLELYRHLFMEKEVHIGLFGFGTVGSGVVQYSRELYSKEKTGYDLTFHTAVVRDTGRTRPVAFPGDLATDPAAVWSDQRLDVVLELMGGVEPARTWILEALRHGKHIVTANKALLAEYGHEIFAAAAKYRRNVGFEASVCGEIPVIDDYLHIPSRSDIIALVGIMNGTSNYILTQMMEGKDFRTALADAQRKGFAEADPTFDISGKDASQKLTILSSLLFHTQVDFRQITLQGLEELQPSDCETARAWGCVIKPLAMVRRAAGGLQLRVCPAFVPREHILASVNNETNALSLYLWGREEPITKIGKGAGAIPTARSIMRDVLDVAKKRSFHMVDLPEYYLSGEAIPHLSGDTFTAPFYVRLTVDDVPGVFGKVATLLGERRLSISQALQKEQKGAGLPHILLQVKETAWGDLKGALEELQALPFVHALFSCMLLT